MCGIVGVLGQHEAAPIMLDALKRLEYRGYDSAGLAASLDGKIERRRAVGKLVELSDLLVHQPLTGKTCIGHTRWATHGPATKINAHPHQGEKVALVHNGIIENFRELREELASQGIQCESDTDTEAVVLLVERELENGEDPHDAVAKTLAKLSGTYALCFLFAKDDDLLIASRNGSPLAIGHGDSEMFVGSDAIALAPLTDRITYLEDGDMAIIRRSGVMFEDAQGQKAKRKTQRIEIATARVSKDGYKHFMAKEIAEQPVVLADAISHYLHDGEIHLPGEGVDFSDYDRVSLIGCGTAFHACYVAKYWFEKYARLPTDIDVASEFRYREPPLTKNTLAIFVSQSGETADTLAALRYCKGKVAKSVAVVNVAESSIARECDLALPIMAGAEIGVASTKAFTCQLAILAALSLKMAADRKASDKEELAKLAQALHDMPGYINQALSIESNCMQLGQMLTQAHHILFIGRGQMYPLALEGALKLKEISYIHAEAYPSGELKHGPIALVGNHLPIIILAPSDKLFEKLASNMHEVAARGGKVLLVTDKKGAETAGNEAWETVIMPEIDPLLAPIVYSIPAQLLAYHTAVAMGTDVDQPRNLAKSVTVE